MEEFTEVEIKEFSRVQLPCEQMYTHSVPKDFKALADPTTVFEYEELTAIDIAL